jgi:hypothetical protein
MNSTTLALRGLCGLLYVPQYYLLGLLPNEAIPCGYAWTFSRLPAPVLWATIAARSLASAEDASSAFLSTPILAPCAVVPCAICAAAPIKSELLLIPLIDMYSNLPRKRNCAQEPIGCAAEKLERYDLFRN